MWIPPKRLFSALLISSLALTLFGCTEVGDSPYSFLDAGLGPDDVTADVDTGAPPDVSMPDGTTTPETIVPEGLDFQQDILPILQAKNCNSGFCHGKSRAGGLSTLNAQDLVEGGKHGPSVVPCEPGAGTLLDKFRVKPSFGSKMPLGGTLLTATQVDIITAWIEEGAGETYDPDACR